VRLGAGNAVRSISGTIFGFFSVPKLAIKSNNYIGIPLNLKRCMQLANFCTIHKVRILVEIFTEKEKKILVEESERVDEIA